MILFNHIAVMGCKSSSLRVTGGRVIPVRVFAGVEEQFEVLDDDEADKLSESSFEFRGETDWKRKVQLDNFLKQMWAQRDVLIEYVARWRSSVDAKGDEEQYPKDLAINPFPGMISPPLDSQPGFLQCISSEPTTT